ncbi:helix-turn-helix transcriptional regulator [Thermopolyspora sp. NPDC052614]|uniref:helix-turn-helix domain-containing protein n=1 Tax=Thermopolyspora sp. NPDC052614 TaxID=3155682 RepID=UPI003448A48B
MARMLTIDPEESPRHNFAYELQRHRLEAGLTQRQLATRVGCSESLIGYIENVKRKPSRQLAEILDRILPSPPDHFLRLYKRATWEEAPEHFRGWLDVEHDATAIRSWSPLLVWGLLQTEQYAQAVFEAEPMISPEQIEERVAARLRRKSILTRPAPPMVLALIDEAVLSRCVGGPKVMSDQLAYILEASRYPNVTVQVVPKDSPAAICGLLGGFSLGFMGGTPYAAYMEAQPKGHMAADRGIVAQLSARYDAIRADAHRQDTSRRIIEDVMNQWAQQI